MLVGGKYGECGGSTYSLPSPFLLAHNSDLVNLFGFRVEADDFIVICSGKHIAIWTDSKAPGFALGVPLHDLLLLLCLLIDRNNFSTVSGGEEMTVMVIQRESMVWELEFVKNFKIFRDFQTVIL